MIETATPNEDSIIPQIRLTDDQIETSEVLDLAWGFFYNIPRPDLNFEELPSLVNLLKFGHKFLAQRIVDDVVDQIISYLYVILQRHRVELPQNRLLFDRKELKVSPTRMSEEAFDIYTIACTFKDANLVNRTLELAASHEPFLDNPFKYQKLLDETNLSHLVRRTTVPPTRSDDNYSL